jgi:hypothetical protein
LRAQPAGRFANQAVGGGEGLANERRCSRRGLGHHRVSAPHQLARSLGVEL